MLEMEIEPEVRKQFVRVCLEHGGLYDDHPWPKDGLTQLCHGRKAQARWEGWDVNEWIRLCDCCLAATVRQGSRWSPFFCERCLPRLKTTRRHGIPIGRHSIMNGIAAPPMGLERFTSSLTGMFSRIDALDRWKVERLGLIYQGTEDPRLPDFLEDVAYFADSAIFDLIDWWRMEVLDYDASFDW